MNCPSRTDEPIKGDGYNQNPASLSADLTTRADLNGMANARMLRRTPSKEVEHVVEEAPDDDAAGNQDRKVAAEALTSSSRHVGERMLASTSGILGGGGSSGGGGGDGVKSWPARVRNFLVTFGKFVGPGFMVSSTPFCTRSASNSYTDLSRLYRSWKLCHRCRCWCNLSIQTSLRCSNVEHLCYLPTKSLYQAWVSEWAQLS